MAYFTPFTDSELEEYTRNVNFKFCDEARNLGVLLPGVLCVAEDVADSSQAQSVINESIVRILCHTWR